MDKKTGGMGQAACPLLLAVVLMAAVSLLIGGCGHSAAPKAETLEPGSPRWVAVEYWKGYYLGQDFAKAWDLMDSYNQQQSFQGNKSAWVASWQKTYGSPVATPQYTVDERKVTNSQYIFVIRLPNHEIHDVEITVEESDGHWKVGKGRKLK